MKILACIIGLLPCLVFGADTVLCVPENPTAADAIKFRLFTEDYCCCAQFSSNGAGVSDSTIYLSYTANTLPCTACRCLLPGAWIEFYSTPLKTGTYTIYELKPYYCPPGQTCLAVMPPPVKVGEVTVGPAATTTMQERTRLPLSGFSIINRGGPVFQVGFSLHSESWINVSVYDAQGRLTATLFDNNVSQGNHSLYWNSSGRNGTYLVCLTRNGNLIASRKVILVK